MLSNEHQPNINIALNITGPSIIATSPLNGAAEVSATTPISIDFSEALNPGAAAIDPILVRVIVGTAPPETWAGESELASDATRITWTPGAPFPPACQVLVTVNAGLTDLQGYALEGGEQNFGFSVERFLLPDDIDASRIRLFMPGRDPAIPDHSIAEGAAGAVPSDVYLWVENLDRLNTVEVISANIDGDFTFALPPFDGNDGYVVGDRLLLHILASAEPGDELAVLPLTPWVAIDGLGAYFSLDGGAFLTTEGLTIDVPFGAYPEGGSVRAAIIDPTSVINDWASFAEPRTAVEVEMSEGARHRVNLIIPGPAPTDPDNNFLVGRILDVAGASMPMMMATASWDVDLSAYVTTVIDPLPPGAKVADVLNKAAADGVPDALLPGIILSGSYVVFEPFIPAQAKADFAARLGDLRILFDGEIAPDDERSIQVRKVFASATNNTAFLNTLYSPGNAVIVGMSFGETAGWAFEELGKIGSFIFDAIYGATIPLRPDKEFVLQVLDPDTGFIHTEQAYPAPTGGFVDIPPVDAPGLSDTHLMITGGDPFSIFAFDAVKGNLPLAAGIDAVKDSNDSSLVVTIQAGALPSGLRVQLTSMKTGESNGGTTVSGSATTLGLSNTDAGVGDSVMLVIEPVVKLKDQELTLIFNKTVDHYSWDGKITAEVIGGTSSPPILNPRAEDGVLYLTPDSAWESGATYNIKIDAEVFSDFALGDRQEFPEGITFPLKVAEAVSGLPVLPNALLGDVAREGDLLFLGDRDGGLRVYDFSDPTAPELMATSSGIVGIGAVASDGFGHVLTVEGKIGQHIALRMYSIDDMLVGGGVQVVFKANLGLSAPHTTVGPGDLEIEVFAESVDFSPHPDSEHGPLSFRYAFDDDGNITGWEELWIPQSILTPNHPVILSDASTGRIYYRGPATDIDPFVIDNDWEIPLSRPLLLRAHAHTVAYASASGGALVAADLVINVDGENITYDFTIVDSVQNSALRDWVIKKETACRELNASDSVYLGRHALTPRTNSTSELLSASRFEGVWNFKLGAGNPAGTINVQPDDIRCVRSQRPAGTRLSDIATAQWFYDAETQGDVPPDPFSLVAVAGHHELAVYQINSYDAALSSSPIAGPEDLGWDPFRVALDPINRLILVRDNAQNMKIFSLKKSGGLEIVADVTLDDPVGFGPLLVDPRLGLAIAGNSPVQYIAPEIEIIADADHDAVFENVEYLQPLGAPMAPLKVGSDGTFLVPPTLAYVRTRILGVPSHVNTVNVKVEGLAPGGGVLPVRPKPYLPSTTIIELEREAGLPLDDQGRHTFVSKRPILLIADERARTERWKAIEEAAAEPDAGSNTELARLTSSEEEEGIYALCRNCDRDLDDDDSNDIPWGKPAPHTGQTPELGSGPEPIEIASAGRVRFTLVVDGSSSGWLQKLEEHDLMPTGEISSIPWACSPTVNIKQNNPVRSASAPEVELDSGVLRLSRSGPALTAPGAGLSLGRDYSSSEAHFGAHGWGWGISGISKLRPNPDGTVDLYTGSGTRYVFHQGSDPETLEANGFAGELKKKRSGGWFVKYPDNSYTEYAEAGYPIVWRDRFRRSEDKGAEIRYSWFADGALARISNSNGARSHETHPRFINVTYT